MKMSEEELATLRAELRTLKDAIKGIQADTKKLIEAEAERRGREKVEARERDYSHDDRAAVWVRALFPVTLITGVVNGIIYFFTSGGGNGGGQ